MGVKDLIQDGPRPLDEQTPQLYAGTVAQTATSPNEEIRVKLNAEKGAGVPMSFIPRVELSGVPETLSMILPQKGDRALVAFDDEGRPWMVGWASE